MPVITRKAMSPKQDSFAAKRVRGLAISAIKGMAMRAAAIEDVASLTWGLPSFATPAHIRDAVSTALSEDPDVGKYTLPDGLPVLREAIAAKHFERTGVRVCPDRNVVVTAGNMQGIKALLDTILEDGDEVIVTDPCFASHLQQIRMCGGKPVFWPLVEASGWSVNANDLEPLIGRRTRAILLVTPSNPTGTLFARDDLIRVAQIAKQRGLLIILDDPYGQFCFDDETAYFNLASAEDHAHHIAYLFTFSKSHAMSGWRLGYAVVPEALKRQMLKVHDATMICAPRPSQLAGLAAMTGDQSHLSEFRDILRKRRALICARLDRVPHVFSYVRPQGAYYVFPRIEAGHSDSESFAIELLEKAQVCLTPGSAFGPSGEDHVRMAFCVEDEVINKAFDRIEAFFGASA
jgi:aminotransferase